MVGKLNLSLFKDAMLIGFLPTQRVFDLILDQKGHLEWNLPILHRLWDEQIAIIIQVIPPGGSDHRYWDKEDAEICSMRAIYKFIRARSIGPYLKWR